MTLSDVLADSSEAIWDAIRHYEYLGPYPESDKEDLITALTYLHYVQARRDTFPGQPEPSLQLCRKLAEHRWANRACKDYYRQHADACRAIAAAVTQQESALARRTKDGLAIAGLPEETKK